MPRTPGLEFLDPCTPVLGLGVSQALGQGELQGQNGIRVIPTRNQAPTSCFPRLPTGDPLTKQIRESKLGHFPGRFDSVKQTIKFKLGWVFFWGGG